MRKAQGSSCRPASALSLSPATLETHALCTVICPAVGWRRRPGAPQAFGPGPRKEDEIARPSGAAGSFGLCWDALLLAGLACLHPSGDGRVDFCVPRLCARARPPGRSRRRARSSEGHPTYLRLTPRERAALYTFCAFVRDLVQHSNVMYLIVEAEKAPKRGKGPTTIHLELRLYRKAHPYHP